VLALTLGQALLIKAQEGLGGPEFSLEELINVRVESVVGASKYEQKVTEAPSSVTIVTSDEIQKFGYSTLADILRSVRGFYVSDDRNYSYVGSRGFLRPGDYNSRYLFLVDGHRMNDNIYDPGYVGMGGTVDVDIIDRVEIIRGPSSSIYGSSAFFGVINVITKKGRDVGGGEVSGEAGSFGTYKGRFSFWKKFDSGIEWLLSGYYYHSDGPERLYYPEFDQRISPDPRARNNGVVRNADAEEAHQFYNSLSYQDFTLSALYSSRTKNVPTASFGSFFGTSLEETTDQRAFVNLAYAHEFSADTTVLGNLSYDAYPYTGHFPYDYSGSNSLSNVLINDDAAFGDWFTANAQLKQRVLDRHTLIVGGEYRENLDQDMSNQDEHPPTTYINDRRNSGTFGVYAQTEIVLRTNLLVNAGLRYDYYYSFAGPISPRLGLIYSPWEESTFKLLYGQAFRAPNNYELYYGSSAFLQEANPNLKPEKIQTYELAYEQYLPAHLRFDASAYYYDIKNLITQESDPNNGMEIFRNVDNVRARGLDFELEGKYPCGLLARASYEWQYAENADTGSELSNSPRHLVKANLLVPFYKDKIFGGLELQYSSSVKTLSNHEAHGFALLNATLFSQKIVKGLDVSASVYNLLGTKYGYPGSGEHLQDVIQQNGCSFRLKLTYKF